MAGYSGTPLVKKLGIKENYQCAFLRAPKDFTRKLGPLPESVKVGRSATGTKDFVLLFAGSEAMLRHEFAAAMSVLKPEAMLWVAWPKKSSGVATDLTFDNVQRIGLDSGLVDVKICAIDETWSGLKFVYRVRDRQRVGRES